MYILTYILRKGKLKNVKNGEEFMNSLQIFPRPR